MVKDAIVSWFLRNIVLPRMEIIDNPGFIIQKISGKGRETFLRELIFPEDLLAEIEREIDGKYGAKGRKALYSAGKKFGYSFSSRSNFTKVSEVGTKDFEKFCYELVRYIETTYASKLVHSIETKLKIFDLTMSDYVVCSKNGLGHVMTTGGIGGIWANIVADKSVECIQPACQGLGHKHCHVIAAPFKELTGHKCDVFKETNLSDDKLTEEYMDLNKVAKTKYASSSLKDLIESNYLEYSHGSVKLSGKRHFLVEGGLTYVLEEELDKINATDLLYSVAKKYGKKLVTSLNEKNTSFLTDYFSAFGWGDVYAYKDNKGYKVVSLHYPWSEKTRKAKFTIFKGFVSGVLSGIEKKDIDLCNVDASTSEGALNIVLS